MPVMEGRDPSAEAAVKERNKVNKQSVVSLPASPQQKAAAHGQGETR